MRLASWRGALTVLLPLLVAVPQVHGQTLRDKFADLFIFGPGQDPLFLAGTGGTAGIQVHGKHFIPSAVSSNGTLIGFLTDAIASNVSNVPIGASSGGETFRIEGSVPVPTSTSAGPIYAERAQTLGRGRLLVGVGRSDFHFSTLRGVPLNDIQLYFTHQNVDFPGCDTIYHVSCKLMGAPTVENDIMQFRLNLDLDVAVTSIYATYGVFDHLDFGVVVPLVDTRLHGNSVAQIIPFGGPTATHFFAGTPENPVLSATRDVSGSSFGLGDVAARVKLLIHETPKASVSLFGDARFPTGSSNDLLGSGRFSARGLAVLTAHVGALSPHANVGYGYRSSSKTQNDVVIATGGFDELLMPHVTIAADVLSELQVGDSKLTLPGPVHYDVPFQRTVVPTDIPNIRDDVVTGSFGFKFSGPEGYTLVANMLVPMNDGGLRAKTTFTFGVEFTF